MIPFGSQLKTFHFRYNNLEVIEDDFFSENPNLEVIWLDGNKIKHVGNRVFETLPKLKTLIMSSNPCSQNDAYNRPDVLKVIKIIQNSCNDLQAYKNFQTLTKKTFDKNRVEQNQKIDQLNTEITRLKQQQLASDKQHQEELQYQLEICKNEVSLKDGEIGVVKKLNEDLALKVAACNAVKPGMSEEKLNEMRDQLFGKFLEMQNQLDATKTSIVAKFDEKFKFTHATLDTVIENVSSINATCSAFDYKLDFLSNSFESSRQP